MKAGECEDIAQMGKADERWVQGKRQNKETKEARRE